MSDANAGAGCSSERAPRDFPRASQAPPARREPPRCNRSAAGGQDRAADFAWESAPLEASEGLQDRPGIGTHAAPDLKRFRGLLDQHAPALDRLARPDALRPGGERRVPLAV